MDPIRTILEKTKHDITADAQSPYPRDYFRASEVGHCWRQVGYSMLGFQESPPPVYQKLTMSSGDAYHRVVRDLLRKAGFEVHNEEETFRVTLSLPVNPGGNDPQTFDLKARVDGSIRLRRGGRLEEECEALLEVKSFSIFFKRKFEAAFQGEVEVDSAGYAWPRRGYWSPDVLWGDYSDQIQMSMVAAGLKVAYVLPVFRDSGWMGFMGRGFLVPQDTVQVQEITQRLGLIHKNYTQKVLMEPEFEATSRQCSYCGYWGECWGKTLGIAQKKKNSDEEMEIGVA